MLRPKDKPSYSALFEKLGFEESLMEERNREIVA
jgi:hypothetical protein